MTAEKDTKKTPLIGDEEKKKDEKEKKGKGKDAPKEEELVSNSRAYSVSIENKCHIFIC